MKDRTLDYYNTHPELFVSDTVDANMSAAQNIFLAAVSQENQPLNTIRLLDYGCGSGRDTKRFLELGYQVEALDGSEELVKIASEYTGIPVRLQLFQELEDVNRFDGIWACASILHVEKGELSDIFRRVSRALKNNGVFYSTFKYGTFCGERNGRYYTDLNEEEFTAICKTVPEFRIEKTWISNDVRPGRSEEKWLNVIVRKVTDE